MRFWQSICTAQLAATYVWIDAGFKTFWTHLAVNAGFTFWAGVVWLVWKSLFERKSRDNGEWAE